MSASRFFCVLTACRAGQQTPSPCTVKLPHKGRESFMQTSPTEHSNSPKVTELERDLVIGIASYAARRTIRKPVVETTTIPEIPQDAA